MRPEVSEALEVLLVLSVFHPFRLLCIVKQRNCPLVFSELPTWKQLISRNIPAPERISLITTIFLDDCQVEMLEHLSVDDTQSFVDVIDEVSQRAIPYSKDGTNGFDSNATIRQLGVG